jgi:hypothetical protein
MPMMSRIRPAQNSLLILKAAPRSWRVYARLRLWSPDSGRRAFKKERNFLKPDIGSWLQPKPPLAKMRSPARGQGHEVRRREGQASKPDLVTYIYLNAFFTRSNA